MKRGLGTGEYISISICLDSSSHRILDQRPTMRPRVDSRNYSFLVCLKSLRPRDGMLTLSSTVTSLRRAMRQETASKRRELGNRERDDYGIMISYGQYLQYLGIIRICHPYETLFEL